MQKKTESFDRNEKESQQYDLNRPKYPQSLVQTILERVLNKSNYLDIGTGTGVLFYELVTSFDGSLVANDLSEGQLNVAKAYAEKEFANLKNIHFVKCSAYDISKNIDKNLKFDLVTIAQSLHFFHTDQILNEVSNNLMNPEGLLGICGYNLEKLQYNFPDDTSFSDKAESYYKTYEEITGPYHESPGRDGLLCEHKNYDFTTLFDNFKKDSFDVVIELSLEQFSRYLKSRSGYSLYIKKNAGQSPVDDPVHVIESNVTRDLEEYYKLRSLQPIEKPLKLNMKYFLLTMTKRFVK